MPENLASEIGFATNELAAGVGCPISMWRVNKFMGNLDHYLRENRGFK